MEIEIDRNEDHTLPHNSKKVREQSLFNDILKYKNKDVHWIIMQVKFNQPFNQAMNREREIAASWFNTVHYKGRVTLPNWMNFRKSSKGEGGLF